MSQSQQKMATARKNDKNKTKDKLVAELAELRLRIAGFEKTEAEIGPREIESRECEELYRQILETSKDGVLFLDKQTGNIVSVNQAIVELLGYSSEEFSGKGIKRIGLLKDIEDFRETIQKLNEVGFIHYNDVPAETKEGQSIDTEIYLIDRMRFIQCHVRDITESKLHEREMEAVLSVSAALRSASTRADMLPIILNRILELMKVEGASVAMPDPISGEIVIELGQGVWENWTGLRFRTDEHVCGYVISTGQTYLSDDVLRDPRLSRPDLIKGLRAMVCVPLIIQGETIGTLSIGRKTNITNEEVRLLAAIGEVAVNAICRATLHEQAVRNIHRFSILHEIDMAISSSLDLRVTLNVLLTHVTTELKVDAAAILLFNPNAQTLEYAAGHGFRTRVIEKTGIKLGEGHVGRAALERRTVSAPNESMDMCQHVNLLKDEGFISHFAVPLIAKGQVKGVLEVFHRFPFASDKDWSDFLESLGAQAAIAIDNATLCNDLQRSNVELTLAYDATIEGWSKALDMRDKETEGHSQRVTDMTLKIAKTVGMSETELLHVRRGALLHDIGKIGIPDSILLKPGPLTDEEWEIMHKHPVLAYELFSPIAFLRPALDIPYCHHERWDGTGYPRGLHGEQIPLAARIFALSDVWDALRSARAYRPPWPVRKVIDHIRSLSGKHFDPKLVEVFLKVIQSVNNRFATDTFR